MRTFEKVLVKGKATNGLSRISRYHKYAPIQTVAREDCPNKKMDSSKCRFGGLMVKLAYKLPAIIRIINKPLLDISVAYLAGTL
jgi:hypothetical protein